MFDGNGEDATLRPRRRRYRIAAVMNRPLYREFDSNVLSCLELKRPLGMVNRELIGLHIPRLVGNRRTSCLSKRVTAHDSALWSAIVTGDLAISRESVARYKSINSVTPLSTRGEYRPGSKPFELMPCWFASTSFWS